MSRSFDRIDAGARARTIVSRLGGRWDGHSGQCRCPAHEDRDPSLSVRLGERAILFKCFAGCSPTEVLRALERAQLHDGTPLDMPTRKAPVRDLTAAARNLWRESVPIEGTLAERYLIARGIPGPHPKLRFHPRTPLGAGKDVRRLPAMLAPVENSLGLVAVQRTFLDEGDVLRRPFPNPKRLLGLPADGAVRLAPATADLGLAEGIEDAVSAAAWFDVPVWAVLGAQRYASVAIPQTVRRVIVYADQDEAATIGLEKALAHLEANGRQLVIRLPPSHKDWNLAWRYRRRLGGGCRGRDAAGPLSD